MAKEKIIETAAPATEPMATPEPPPAQYYRVHAKRPEYHCIRRKFTPDPVEIPVAELSAEQLAELERDPFIVVSGPFPAAAEIPAKSFPALDLVVEQLPEVDPETVAAVHAVIAKLLA